MLTVVNQAEAANGSGARRAIKINGIRIDLATAEHVITHPGGDCNFEPMDNCRRFDEELYRTPEGYWFIVRPLDPEEAEGWIIAHGDEPLARQLSPTRRTDPSTTDRRNRGRYTRGALSTSGALRLRQRHFSKLHLALPLQGGIKASRFVPAFCRSPWFRFVSQL